MADGRGPTQIFTKFGNPTIGYKQEVISARNMTYDKTQYGGLAEVALS